MSPTRKLASRLLRVVLRYTPAESRDWVNAMLREMDFIERDWAALFWALGSTAAIFRHAGRGLIAWFNNHWGRQDKRMNNIGKKTFGIGSGIVIAGALVLCAFGLLRLAAYLFPGLGLDHMEWTHWLTVIVIPEAIFIVATVALWRKKGPVAVGILLSAIMLAMHVVIHVTSH